MGDRCYLTFTLTGHIPSMEALEAISEAIEGEGLLPEYSPGVGVRSIITAALMDATHIGGVPFFDEGCNYANVSGAEDVCQDYGVAYTISHDSGGDYPAGKIAFLPGVGRFEETSDGSDTAVPLWELQALLNGPSPLDAIGARIKAAACAAGEGQPERITASPGVIAALKAERDGESSEEPENPWLAVADTLEAGAEANIWYGGDSEKSALIEDVQEAMIAAARTLRSHT